MMLALSKFHKVQSVAALPDFVLGVRFAGGEEKRYDMKSVFAAWPMFEGLEKSPELFGEVAVGPGGYGVVWGDEWDVGADELFANGVRYGVCTMQNAECTMGEGENDSTSQRANDPTILRHNDPTMQRSNEPTSDEVTR